MKKMLLVCGLITVGLLACTSQEKTVNDTKLSQRDVAQSPHNHSYTHNHGNEAEMEGNFQAIMNSTKPSAAAISKVEKLFTLLLISNQFIDNFDKKLDEKIKYKKQFPNAVVEEPLHTEEYKKLLKAWNLKEKYTEEVQYIYARTLSLRTDESQPQEIRDRARQIFKEVTKHFMTSIDLKRAEFQPLLANLKTIYKFHVTEYKAKKRAENINPTKQQIKDIAAISEKPEFDPIIISDTKKLEQFTKSVSSKSKITSALKSSSYVSDVEADLAQIADPIFETRGPQSEPADLSCKEGKKLCVSTGENGNIVGAVFPKGVWAFTYDDGPAPQATSDIMDLFINYKDAVNPVGKATFFWTAANVLKNGQWVAKAVKHDFPIANHSYSHADLNRAETDRKKQIITSNEVIESAIHKFDPGYKIQYFRCPYGSCYAPKIPAVRQMLVDQGQIHAYWRIDSLDWKLLDSEKVAALVIKQMQLMDHGVILMHDVHPTTVGATRIVLNWMKSQNNNKGANYKMVTIQEAVDLTNAKK